MNSLILSTGDEVGRLEGQDVTSRKAIWIIEDDENMQFVYADILENDYDLVMFGSLQDFAAYRSTDHPQLYILDLMLPDGLLYQSFSRFRHLLQSTPFLVVSGLDDEDAIRDCFSWGAVDFISKPFGRAELLYKVERQLSAKSTAAVVQPLGSRLFQLDPLTMTAANKWGCSPELTAREYRILSLFLEAKEARVSRQELFDTLWRDVRVSGKTLDVHLSHIRRKIAPMGLAIVHRASFYEVCRVELPPGLPDPLGRPLLFNAEEYG